MEAMGMDSGVAVLKKTVKLINHIADNGKAIGVSELSKELKIPKATVHRILNTLCGDNVIQLPDRKSVV